MTFLPIVERELRVAARRASTYWVRSYAALGVLVLVLFLLLTGRRTSPTQMSQNLFVAMGVVSLGFAMLAGVFLTADCLSEEKREGTLGLLFLTDLKGYDVVLGKLVATSLHAVYGLLAIFPLLAIPLLMGGVTGGEFWRVILVLLFTLVLSLALGMFSSAFNSEARQAMSGAFIGMLTLAGILPTLWWLQEVILKTGWTGLLLWPSPVYAYRAAFDASYRLRGGPHQFWASMAVLAALGLVCLIVAAVRLPRGWQERERPAAGQGTAPCCPETDAISRSALRSELLNQNPFFWLASSALARSRLPWTLLGFLTVLWLVFLAAGILGSSRWREAVIASFFINYALHQLAKYLVAVEASRQLSQDKQSGALELLLVTPLEERSIVAGQVQALQQHFAALQYLLITINLFMAAVIVVFSGPLHMGHTDRTIFLELHGGGLLVLVLDMRALMKVGMWMALRTPKHHRAVLATLGRVLLPPWIGILLLVFLLQGGRSGEGVIMLIFACWFGLGILTDRILSTQAMAGLNGGFRQFLTSRESPPKAPVAAARIPGLNAQRA